MNPKIKLLNKFIERQNRNFTRPLPIIPKRDICMLASLMKHKFAAKGEIILNDGEVLQDIIFVEEGMVRQFYYKNNTDITEHFSCEGDYVLCIESLFLSKPTSLMIEALEPTSYYTINYSELEQLFERSKPMLNIYRHLAETNLIYTQYKADAMRFESSRERYQNFIKQYPEAAKRAKIRHIASYLLMTPESLSRVRNKLVNEKD